MLVIGVRTGCRESDLLVLNEAQNLLDKQREEIIKLIEGVEQIYINEQQATIVPANAVISRHKQSVIQKILTEIKKG